MKLVKTAALVFRQGNSDKVHEVDIGEVDPEKGAEVRRRVGRILERQCRPPRFRQVDARPPSGGTEPVSASPRVLIVDDDPDAVLLMKRVFTRWGWEPVEASDVDEAVVHLAEPFDLIVLDLTLPRVSGAELLREVRARGLSVPVAVMTGKPLEAASLELTGLNPDRIFIKSFDFDEIRDFAQAISDRFRADRLGPGV